MTELENPYKTLGVERTSDTRAIKKAYVALIRKFSPEAHPEEFKKIRAAYELLSDADARARFDDSERGYSEYGEEVGRRLAEVDAALAEGKPELAREILEHAAAHYPAVTVVQEKLGFLLLTSKEIHRALAVFNGLVTKEPQNGRHYFHCALALARLENPSQAEHALRSAHHLEPKVLRYVVALAEFLIARGRPAEALPLTEESLRHFEGDVPSTLTLLLRRVEAYVRLGNDATLMATIDDVGRRVEAASDKELGPFVATQLAGIAAGLFEARWPSAANRILSRCGEFSANAVERPFPVLKVADPDALPEAFRVWLEGVAKQGKSPFTLRGRTWLLPGFALYVAAAFLVSVLWMLLQPKASIGLEGWIGASVLVGAGAIGFALALARALHILRRPLRSFTSLHPLYLIEATPDRVSLYPLFMLTNMRCVHQHLNGIYVGSSVTLTFGDDYLGVHRLHLSTWGQGRVQHWLQVLAAVRARSLELLAEGCLDSEDLVENLLPGACVSLTTPVKRKSKKWALSFVKPVLAGLLATAIAVPIGGRIAIHSGEDVVVATAASKGTPEAWQAFIDAHPKSRHLELAKAAKETADARAAQRSRLVLAGTNHPAANAAAAIEQAIAYVREHRGRIAIDVAVEGESFGARDAAARALREHLERVLRLAGIEVLFTGEPGPSPAPRISVRLSDGASRTLRADVGASVSTRPDAGPPPKFADLVTRGAIVEVAIETPASPPFRSRLEVEPPDTIYGLSAADSAMVATTERAFDAATSAFGFLGPTARLEASPSEKNAVVTVPR